MRIKELLENDDLDNIADGTTRSHPIEDDEDDFDYEEVDNIDDPDTISNVYIDEMVLAIDDSNPEEFDSCYDAARNYQSDKTLLKVIAEYIGSMEPNKPNEKAHLIKFILGLIKGEFADSAQTIVKALRINQVNWPELAIIQKSLDALNEGEIKGAADSITDGSDRRKYIALRNMEADRLAKTKATKDPIKQAQHRKMAQQHNDDANVIMNKYRNKPVSEAKIKGADGKACWKGYRYAGTEKGKDKCVKVKKAKK